MFNNFFTLCESSDNKVETYNCCIKTCTTNSSNPSMCYPMCAQVFPMIKDQCAFKFDCWKDGHYNPYCMKINEKGIKECCLRDCEQYSYSLYPETLDCESYCSDYTIKPEDSSHK